MPPMLALSQLSNHRTLKGSFSAVSKPNFASKYAFESSRRDLHNALESPLHSSAITFFLRLLEFAKFWGKKINLARFAEFCKICFLWQILTKNLDHRAVQRSADSSALCRSRRELSNAFSFFSLSPCPFFSIFFSNQIAIQTSIYLQNLASIQPRTSLSKFAKN